MISILMHQMSISTNKVSSVKLMPKKLEIGKNMKHACFFVCFVYNRLSNFSAIRRLSLLPVTGLKI
jgi:hypothetical protein